MSMNCSLPDIADLTPTAEKRVAAFLTRLAQPGALDEDATEQVIPALDLKALAREFSMSNAWKPRPEMATFQVPRDPTVKPEVYAKIAKQSLETWFKAMDQQGYDLILTDAYPLAFSRGVDPARNLETGADILDRREIIVRAWFRFRDPKPVRVMVPAGLTEERRIVRSVPSAQAAGR